MPRHSLTLLEKSGLLELKIPLIWLILLTAVACLSKYLRKLQHPQRENSMCSKQCRNQTFRKSCIHSRITLLYLSSHFESFWVSDINKWDVFVWNLSVSQELFRNHWNYLSPRAIPCSCDLVNIYASCGFLWSMLFRCWFRCCSSDRSSANCRLNSSCVQRDGGKLGTTCLAKANAVCLRVYQSQWMSPCCSNIDTNTSRNPILLKPGHKSLSTPRPWRSW